MAHKPRNLLAGAPITVAFQDSPFPLDRERDEKETRIREIQDYINDKMLTIEEATALIELRGAIHRAYDRRRSRNH
jgi:hypothetical protein